MSIIAAVMNSIVFFLICFSASVIMLRLSGLLPVVLLVLGIFCLSSLSAAREVLVLL